MTPFDPKHPHGHVTLDGRKATVHCVLEDGTIVASVENQIGGVWSGDGRWIGRFGSEPDLDLLNAPAPKRTWEVVAIELSGTGGVVVFRPADCSGYENDKIIGRYTLPEGQGMEEKDGA